MRMRTLSILVALALLPTAAWAQHQGEKEITPQIGWQYGGTQEYSSYPGYAAGDFHANANLNYGGMLSIFIRDYYAIEFAYSYQSTDLLIRPNGFPDTKIADLAAQYIHLYGTRVIPTQGGKTDLFAMGGFGATTFSAGSPYESRWLFSFGAGIGAKVHMNPKTSLRLQTRLLIPIQWGSAGFYFGTGGSGIDVGGGSSIVQGDVSLGLAIKLGT